MTSRQKELKTAMAAAIITLLTSLLCFDAAGRTITERDRQHWAFQPIKRVGSMALQSSKTEGLSAIDQFIVAKLETNQLALVPRASREQLIRRVTFGLIGLPPTPEEIDAFVKDASPSAYEKLIDRLLASPHYGERWGRHWLDLARFAESDGFEHDAVRPHSWRYRDYVIKSFNDDKPYDQFIREQIAGDELFPDNPEALVATGFNLLGPDMVDSADQVQRRLNTLNDMTDTTALVFLGQTLGCARCHNHKSEPFSQRDYYQFQAFFTPTKFQRELPVPTAAQRATHKTELGKYNELTASQQKQIEAIETPHRERLHAEKLARLSEEAQLAHKTPKEKRTVEMENQIQETADLLKVTDAELLKSMSPEDRKRRTALLEELKKFPKPKPLPVAMALQNSNGPPAKTFVLGRGDYNDPRDEVQAGFPEILRGSRDNEAHSKNPEKDQSLLTSAATRNPRTTLANWIASPENPLTARVMVNRIWQHHFGRGIVPSPSEFGVRAEPPTHPELLDWLASEFIARGWSIKQMHKVILLSATYQQSSQPSAEALARDPENKLFSRQNRARLEGEVIRDSLLAISGQLNRKVAGPSVFPPIPADITKTSKNWTAGTNAEDHARRSLYVFARRNLRFPFLEAFDAPDSNLSCAERGRSTTAPQSLTLLNAEEVMTAASLIAAKLKETQPFEQQINRAFRLTLGRGPSAKERALAHDFLAACSSRREEAPIEKAEGEKGKAEKDQSLVTSAATMTGMEELCRALFNLNAFVYVD